MHALDPGIPHWYEPERQIGWDEYWVGFRGTYPADLLKKQFVTSNKPVFFLGLHESILKTYMEIFEIAKIEPPFFQQKLGALVMFLLAEVLSYSQQKEFGSEVDALVRQARFLMEEKVFSVLDIEELSNRLGINSSSFRRIFKTYTGLSPSQWHEGFPLSSQEPDRGAVARQPARQA